MVFFYVWFCYTSASMRKCKFFNINLIVGTFSCCVSGQDILLKEDIPQGGKVLKIIDQGNDHGLLLLIGILELGNREETFLSQDSALIRQRGILKENFHVMAMSEMSGLFEINGMLGLYIK